MNNVRDGIAQLQMLKGKAHWNDGDRLVVVGLLSDFLELCGWVGICPELGVGVIARVVDGDIDDEMRAELIDFIDCRVLPVLIRWERGEVDLIFPHKKEREKVGMPFEVQAIMALLAFLIGWGLYKRFRAQQGG